jgi:hypothetical protein
MDRLRGSVYKLGKDCQNLAEDVKHVEHALVNRADKIMSNFANYAKFDDLKELYSKTIPEI